jgi:hypothetical protein
VHDFSLPKLSDDGIYDHSSTSDGANGIPDRYSSGSLSPWPMVYRLAGSSDVEGNQLPFLTHHGGSAQWPSPAVVAQEPE